MNDHDRRVAEFAQNNPEFHSVPGLREHMGRIMQADLALMQNGHPSLGTLGDDGQPDLDHAFHLAKLTHPHTRRQMQAARRQEQVQAARHPQQQLPRRAGPPESVGDAVRRSVAELKGRGGY
jgi:hypothetical protein